MMRIIAAIAAVGMMLFDDADDGDGTSRQIFYWILRMFLGAMIIWLLIQVAFGDASALPMLAVFTACMFPWTMATRVFAPLGMWRCAFAFGFLARLAFEGTRGSGVVAGAWALARRGRANPNAIAFLQRRRDKAKSVSAAHILATALLAEARGDRAGARVVFASIELLGPKIPVLPRKLAREWLCADAVERGAWSEAVKIAAGGSARSRATRFLGAAAARMCRQPDAPANVRLRLLWLLAPHRRRTRPLLSAALGAASQPEPETKQTETSTEMTDSGERPDTLAMALKLHVQAVASSATPASLGVLGRAWDRALDDPNTRDGTLHRAAVLGAPSGSRALSDLEIDIRSEIATLVRESGVSLAELPEGSAVLSAAANQVREDMLAELEVAFDALARRVSNKRPLAGTAEWREFTALRSVYLRAAQLGGMSLRRIAFPDMHQRICALAVWLWNERKQYIIAQGMFLWLLDEAIAVGDEQAIELQRKNTTT